MATRISAQAFITALPFDNRNLVVAQSIQGVHDAVDQPVDGGEPVVERRDGWLAFNTLHVQNGNSS